MKLTSEQKVKVTIRPVTAGGNPARIDGAVTFASENEEVVRIEMIDDTTAEAIAVAPGTARITATFDADLDEDETRLLTFDAEIVVEEAEAVGGEVEFAAPEYLILTPIGEPEAHEETAVPATEDTEEAAPADEPTAVESESVVEDSSDVSDSAPPVEDAAVGDEPTAP